MINGTSENNNTDGRMTAIQIQIISRSEANCNNAISEEQQVRGGEKD